MAVQHTQTALAAQATAQAALTVETDAAGRAGATLTAVRQAATPPTAGPKVILPPDWQTPSPTPNLPPAPPAPLIWVVEATQRLTLTGHTGAITGAAYALEGYGEDDPANRQILTAGADVTAGECSAARSHGRQAGSSSNAASVVRRWAGPPAAGTI